MRGYLLISFLLCVVHAMQCQDLPGEKIYDRCAGAVVEVGVQDDLGRTIGGGTGVVLKDSAWLITNYHIFQKGGYLVAQKDGKQIDLRGGILRADAMRDILILKINTESEPELWAHIPDLEVVGYDKLKRGQKVYAIGNPLGLETTITDGLLSGLRTAEDTVERLLQISAPISPGSSGGGVFDGQGKLIGISTFIMGAGVSQNLNFALPVDEIIHWDRTATRLDIKAYERNVFFEAGLTAWRNHRCDEAVASFREIPMDDPSKGQALYYTGRCYHHYSDYKQARSAYEMALDVDPKIARAHAFLAVLCLQDGDQVGAIEHQRIAYALDTRLRDAKVVVDDW